MSHKIAKKIRKFMKNTMGLNYRTSRPMYKKFKKQAKYETT